MTEPRSVVVDLDGEQLLVMLDNDDEEGQWGSARDARGNRIEVYVFDGDPYDVYVFGGGGPA